MKNSKFVIEKLAKLFEQGLVSSKDLANELMIILKSKRDEIVFKMKLTSKDEFEILSKRVENLEKKINSIKIKTVGIVHGLPGKIHNLRLIKSLIKIPKASKPQIIFSTGKKINSEFIKNGFKNSFEIGYPRENKSIPNFNLSLIKKKKY